MHVFENRLSKYLPGDVFPMRLLVYVDVYNDGSVGNSCKKSGQNDK